MGEIEATLTQFGGAFDGAAGPVRSVAGRTCDLLPSAARIAELLHPEFDLGNRVGRLAIRLTLGVPAAAVALAQHAGANLLRGDYRRLAATGLCAPDAIAAADDAILIECVGGEPRKLDVVRRAAQALAYQREQAAAVTRPVLEPYEA